MGRRIIKRGAGKKHISGKDFLLAEEIEYIRSRAAEHDGRLVTVGPLVFSTETGNTWLLDPADSPRRTRGADSDPEDIHFEETDTNFAIGSKGDSQIDGDALPVFIDRDTARVTTILGYPARRLAQVA